MNDKADQQASLSKDQPKQEESIFNEDELIDDRYMQNVRRARNTIFWVAGIEFVIGFIMAIAGPNEEFWISFGISAIAGLIFLGLGIWAGKNPYPAILTALILYVTLNVLGIVGNIIINEGLQAARGIIVKIIIVVYLIKGLNNAAEARRIKNALGTR